MNNDWDYDKIMSDRDLFHKTVYTPLSEAIKILEERKKDKSLKNKIEELLKNDIPEPFINNEICIFQLRQIATPNYEGQWFIKIAQDYNLKPVFCEYYDDKFISKNNFKLSLGKIKVHCGLDKNGNYLVEKINIIDLLKSDGKSLKDVRTLKDESLIDFHRNLFDLFDFDQNNFNFFDMSKWFKDNGKNIKDHYNNIMLLFITHGILFENFIIDGDEGDFSRKIILPALKRIEETTGIKPLIVPIPPMDKEYDEFVTYYPIKIKSILTK